MSIIPGCDQILYGNLAPEGCVGKITGKEGLVFEGSARVFDCEEDMLAALSENPDSLKARPHVMNQWLYLGRRTGLQVQRGIRAVQDRSKFSMLVIGNLRCQRRACQEEAWFFMLLHLP